MSCSRRKRHHTGIRPPCAISDDRLLLGELSLDGWEEPRSSLRGDGHLGDDTVGDRVAPARGGRVLRVQFSVPDRPLGRRRLRDGRAVVYRSPGGEVTDLYYATNGFLRVRLWDSQVRPAQVVPPQGWNCPTN